MQVSGFGKYQRVFLFAFVILLGAQLFAATTASISGTVKDGSGAALAGAKVTAVNTGTHIEQTQNTNSQGYFSFPYLPIGNYDVVVQQSGFKEYRQTGVVLNVNDTDVVDVTMQVGQVKESVTVESEALHVETVSSQMGEVIESKKITDVPLVSRSYTDLLALQPGVTATASQMTGAYGGAFISAGFAVPQVSGDLNSGALSVNGMRESANGFILNGVLVQELGYSGAGAIPNLDSIAEFRILTNNFDAEFGNYAGSQINVVTKSGTNQWHGNVFEFLRNTHLDAKNFFDQTGRGAYHENQFGGTFGGPIVKDKVFFFADYQGNRVIQAVPQTIANAPTTALESGDLSGIIDNVTGSNVTGQVWADQLASKLNLPAGTFNGDPNNGPLTPYYKTGCTSYPNCIFINQQVDPRLVDPISKNLLPFIQTANTASGAFSTSSGKINLHDNKFSGRVDDNSRFGTFSAYYYFDRYDRIDPYWPGNAPVMPGFAIDGKGQTHNINLGMTKTLSSTAVNEVRLGYFRLNTTLNRPLGGTGTTLADLGFASGDNGQPGIFVGTPSVQGVPEIDFNNFVIGVPSRPNQLIDNIYQVLDNFSKVVGTHTIKFGGQFHFNQLEENLSNVANGNFFFGTAFNGGNSETGSDFVDFLLGAPSSYVQGQSYPSYGRSFYWGAYGQDSWRARPNLTLNFGLRYDVASPFWEKYNEIQTIIPGEQSVVFPGSPKGWVFPGDPHVPRTLAPTRWNNFAPRIGLAYSFGDHDGVLGKILGKSGSSSLRAGYTLSYASFEGATDFNEIGDAPFGNYTGQFGSTFAAPFTCRATCATGTGTNLFPVAPPPKHFSASNPAHGSPYDNLAEFFSAFGTVGSSPAFFNGNRLPYAENYELSLQRQITGSDLLTLSYVGTQGHRLLSSVSANPGNPGLCNSIASSLGCAPGGENNIYYDAGTGSAVLGTRSVLSGVLLPVGTDIGAKPCLQGTNGQACVIQTGPNQGQTAIIPFGNDSYFKTAGSSSYNSLQVNYRHTSGRLQTLLAYTYSKAIDNASGYGEQFNPIDPRISRGLAAFDSTHNFVVSYTYLLPFDRLGGPKKLTNGWSISGVTTFATGLPITLVETDDHSLLGTAFGGPIPLAVDTPDQVAPLHTLNPRHQQTFNGTTGNYFFDPTSFQPSAIGFEGNAKRRFFHGPGTNNWNMAFHKDTKLSERLNLQFRADFFNMFNHTQFVRPSGILTSSFGQVTQAAPPRLGQLSLKLNF